MHCNSLYIDEVFCHDENCYMPELSCGALDRVSLPNDKYVVRAIYVDDGGAERTICCFDDKFQAADFMDDYKGSGDYLICYLDGKAICSKDLWLFEPGVNFDPGYREEQVHHDYIYDEDIPF